VKQDAEDFSPAHAGAAVDRQRHARNKTCFVRRQEEGGVRDVPAGAHLVAQRHLGVALGRDFGAALLEGMGAGVDRHRRIHQPGQDDVGANAVLGVLVGELLGEGDHRRFRGLIGDVGIGGDRRHRGDVDDGAAHLVAHDRDRVFRGKDAALEIDRDAAIDRLLGNVGKLGVAAGEADADIVVQDVDAAPAAVRVGDHGLDLGLLGDVGLEGYRRAALGGDHVDRFLRGFDVAIHTQHAREGKRRGAAVADAFAGLWPAPTTIAIRSFRRMSLHSRKLGTI